MKYPDFFSISYKLSLPSPEHSKPNPLPRLLAGCCQSARLSIAGLIFASAVVFGTISFGRTLPGGSEGSAPAIGTPGAGFAQRARNSMPVVKASFVGSTSISLLSGLGMLIFTQRMRRRL